MNSLYAAFLRMVAAGAYTTAMACGPSYLGTIASLAMLDLCDAADGYDG